MPSADTPNIDIESIVISAIQKVSKMNGHENLFVDESTNPFDLPEFDSITSVEVVSEISKNLEFNIVHNPFLSTLNDKAASVKDVVDSIKKTKKEGS